MHASSNVNTTSVSNLNYFNSLVNVKQGEGKLIQATGPASFQVISPSFGARILLTFFGYKSADTRYEVVNQTVKAFYAQKIEPDLNKFTNEQLASIYKTLTVLKVRWANANVHSNTPTIETYQKNVKALLVANGGRSFITKDCIKPDLKAQVGDKLSTRSSNWFQTGKFDPTWTPTIRPTTSSRKMGSSKKVSFSSNLKLGGFIEDWELLKIKSSDQEINKGDFALVKRTGKEGYQCVQIKRITGNKFTFADGSGNFFKKKSDLFVPIKPQFIPLNDSV